MAITPSPLSNSGFDFFQDSTAGLKWGDHEHYLYQLVDKNGDLCVKGTTPPSVGAEIGADSNVGDAFTDDCSNGVYYLVMTVTVDGVTSSPIEVLFARGVEMTGSAMQSAFAQLQSAAKAQQAASQKSTTSSSDNATTIGAAGLIVAALAFVVASYAAFKPQKAAPKPPQAEMAEPNIAIN